MAHTEIHKLRVRRRGTKGKRRDQLTKQIQALRPKPKVQPSLTAPLGPKQIGPEIDAATRLRYGEQERDLEARRRASERFTRQMPEYFRNYQDQIAGIRQRNEAAALAEQQGLDQRARETSIAEEAARKALSEQEAQQAARVQGVAPSVAPDQQAQAAATARRASLNDFQANLGLQRQAQRSYEGARQIGGLWEEARMLEGEGRYRRGIEQRQTDLKADKGAFRTEYRSKLRDSERDWLLKTAAAEEAGVDVAAKERAADLLNRRYRAGRRQAGREARKTIAFQNAQNRELLKLKQQIRDSYKPPTSGGGGKKKDSYGSDDIPGAKAKLRVLMNKHGAKSLIGTSVKGGKRARRLFIDELVKLNFSKTAAYQAVKWRFEKDMEKRGWGK